MTAYNLHPTDSATSHNQDITVNPLGIDNSTDLTFLGRGYANYGQIQQTNVLKLLENFASVNEPAKPIIGQIWYHPIEEMLRVCVNIDTSNGGHVVTWVTIQDMATVTATLGTEPATTQKGALWYDFSVISPGERLKVYDGSAWITIVSNAVISIGVNAPAIAQHGQLWYDLASSTLKAWNSTSSLWFPVASSTVQDDSLKYAFILAM